MMDNDSANRDLDAARRAFPVGDHIDGTVSLIPRPGAVGLFVALEQQRIGFVDVAMLPLSPSRWPPVGTTTRFEVLQHRHGQIRLWPLDDAFRLTSVSLPMDKPTWQEVKRRYPIGSEVDAEIIDVFPSNREYTVLFGGVRSHLAWTGAPPIVGARARFFVDRHLDTTRRILLRG